MQDDMPDKQPMTKTPDWLVGFLIAVVVVTAGWLYLQSIGAGDDPVLGSETSSDDSGADSGSSFALFDGTPASFSDFSGPIVVNFWASWCPACVAELPDFESVSQSLGDRVTFIGMNVLPDDRAAAEALIAQTGVTYQLAEDDGGALFAEFGGLAMPTTVFIDADGDVVDVHSGTIFEDDLRERISELFGV
jgi:thiol-disulfide isomerase/thioredoxin